MWRKLNGAEIDLFQTLNQDILKYQEDFNLEFITGCDSQIMGSKINYITVIVMRRKYKDIDRGNGGLVYYQKEVEPMNYIQPKKRLWNEVQKSVATALELDEFLLEYDLEVQDIHADLNPDKQHLSNSVVNECLGYIRAMGYNGVIKPDSWASSKVADKKSR